jgi:hypothetical protein
VSLCIGVASRSRSTCSRTPSAWKPPVRPLDVLAPHLEALMAEGF